MNRLTYRQLAVRFVAALGISASTPSADSRSLESSPGAGAPIHSLDALTTATIAAAREAGLRDMKRLLAAIEHELLQRHGVAEIELSTARALNKAEQDELGAEVARLVGATSYSLSARVDADLIGGFEAQAAGRSIRRSVRDRIQTINTVGA